MTDDDYERLLKVPAMDKDVQKRLPVGGRSCPASYQGFWEDELKSVDAHLRSCVRLSAFQLMALNHIGKEIDGEETPEVFQAVELASTLSSQILAESMGLAARTIVLRRENACASLKKSYVQDLSKALKDVPLSHSSLFGSELQSVVEQVATQVTNENTLRESLADVTKGSRKTKRSKKKKANTFRSKKAKVTPTSTTTTAPPSYGRKKGKGKGKGKGRGPGSKKTKGSKPSV